MNRGKFREDIMRTFKNANIQITEIKDNKVTPARLTYNKDSDTSLAFAKSLTFSIAKVIASVKVPEGVDHQDYYDVVHDVLDVLKDIMTTDNPVFRNERGNLRLYRDDLYNLLTSRYTRYAQAEVEELAEKKI